MAAVDVILPSVPIDKKSVTKPQIAFREFIAHVLAANPGKMGAKKYAKQWDVALTAPLGVKNILNRRRLAQAERESRRYMKGHGINVGEDWRLSARDWTAFLEFITGLMEVLIPLFATCGV